MAKTISKPHGKKQSRCALYRRRILAVDTLCAGTLVKRFNTCGKPHCPCMQDPSARHGPYHIWSRREGGRLVQTVVSPSQAKEIALAIQNYRRVLRLLAAWSRESARAILAADGVNH